VVSTLSTDLQLISFAILLLLENKANLQKVITVKIEDIKSNLKTAPN